LVLALVHPGTRGVELFVSKIAHRGRREWAAKSRHPLVPRFLSDNRQTPDMAEGQDVAFHVLPKRARIPAMKIVHRMSMRILPNSAIILSVSGTNIS
jgi:hypothetical protein